MKLNFDNCETIQETRKAVGIKLKEFDKIIWFPKSKIEYNKRMKLIFIPDWLWDKKVDELFQ